MKVCVIGSGPSGLTTIKQLLDEGHDVTCFDKNEHLGGIWYRNNTTDVDQMKVYDTMMLTISMGLMGYSDFVVPEMSERIYHTRERYLKYLEAYAERFQLGRRIQFDSEVREVRRAPGDRFEVVVRSRGEEATHLFDAVAVCAGPFQKPRTDVTDIKKFTGEVSHSSRYRNAERFRNKRVLVVGLAESGADVLRQISDVAADCVLTIRSRSFLLPRLFAGRYSSDEGDIRAHNYEQWIRATKIPFPVKGLFGDSKLARAAFRVCAATSGLATAAALKLRELREPSADELDRDVLHDKMGQPTFPRQMDHAAELRPEYMQFINEWNRKSHHDKGNWTVKIILCKNATWVPNAVDGKISIDDTGIERIDGNRVRFRSGEERTFDAIVTCTGFERDFSLLGPDIKVPDNNVRNLYKHAFHPDHAGRLAFIGFVRPFAGGIPACSEMQARYFAQLCSNKLKLPADVRARIRAEKAWEEAFTELSPNQTESIPSQSLFQDGIAREIGCLPSIWQILRDPRMFARYWFYPANHAFYRLVGPHAQPEVARHELMTERRGQLTISGLTALFSALMLLPHNVHPVDHVFPVDMAPSPKRAATEPVTLHALESSDREVAASL
jgi:cation diffusion facilitator CzcD-associated flavoprotein CzcO